MSCNGCRILRKGCSDNCLLRQCLQSIESPQAQANATIFVAKFFGRAGLMSFISAVPQSQRPALFQSLLFEAVGRTVNPVGGAVGLLCTGNWHVGQSAVQTVLGGGVVQALPEFVGGASDFEEVLESAGPTVGAGGDSDEKKRCDKAQKLEESDIDLCLMNGSERRRKRRRGRAASPSEESETTTLGSGDGGCSEGGERKILRLFI